MTSTNSVTGDRLVSKPSNILYEDGWDRIFTKNPIVKQIEENENFDEFCQRNHIIEEKNT